MQSYLQEHGLIGPTVETFYPRTRDRADIPVLRCRQTGVIFLGGAPEDLAAYYGNRQPDNDGTVSRTQLKGTQVVTIAPADSQRRLDQFRAVLSGKRICDFGTGHGLFLRYARGVARDCAGVELNRLQQDALRADGIRVESSIKAYAPASFDVVTLFHVLEHLPDPIGTLQLIHSRLAPGGSAIVEIPHARDFLFTTLGSEAFKAFTFWSEHLVLHTRTSLGRVLALAGFSDVSIKGYQRYGLENHLHWLVKGKPGGQQAWAHLAEAELNGRYAGLLQSLDQTDTLIAIARP
jgi:2-polyprenyl-3-methyl-5-hydroxy-6-metoxy-1,4-benzoquinol methylase